MSPGGHSGASASRSSGGLPAPVALRPLPATLAGPPSARWTATMAVLGSCSVAAVAVLTWLASAAWFRLDEAVYLLGAHHLGDGRLYQVGLPTVPHLPFTYPPAAALAFWPLAALPDLAARACWALVQVGSLLALIGLSLRAAAPGADARRTWLWAAVLCGPAYLLDPVRLTIYFGQVNLVLAAVVLADLTVPVRVGRVTLPRGVLIGLAGAVKLVPLIFVPFLALTGRLRAAAWAAGSFLAATAAAALVTPDASWSYWTRHVRDAARVGEPGFFLNQSLLGVADRAVHHHLAAGTAAVAEVAVAVAGLLVARAAHRAGSPFLAVVACAATGLLASPISWQHHAVWVVPALVWLAVAPDRPAGGPVVAAVGFALVWWSPLEQTGGPPGWRHLHGWTQVAGASTFLLVVAGLAGTATLAVLRRRRGLSGAACPAPTAAAAPC